MITPSNTEACPCEYLVDSITYKRANSRIELNVGGQVDVDPRVGEVAWTIINGLVSHENEPFNKSTPALRDLKTKRGGLMNLGKMIHIAGGKSLTEPVIERNQRRFF